MNSLERNNFSPKNRNIFEIQNKDNIISIINKNNLRQNKLKLLNLVDKTSFINNLDRNIKKLNNDSKINKTQNNIINKKRLLNKLILNIEKQEKESFKNNINYLNNIGNSKNFDNKNRLNINNISSYRSKVFINRNNNKMNNNYIKESHHLINSLLKNQNKPITKENDLNQAHEQALSSSFDNHKKIIETDISPLKEALELNKNKEQKDGRELFFSRNIRRMNSANTNEIYNSNNSKNNENNIYFGVNKENKDINLVKNRKELLISPLYNLDNNNNYNNGNRTFRSPLRMADVSIFKKLYPINPSLKSILTTNNIKEIKNTSNRLKTMLITKKEFEDEKTIKENIKNMNNLKVNLINNKKEKEKDFNYDEKNKNVMNKKDNKKKKGLNENIYNNQNKNDNDQINKIIESSKGSECIKRNDKINIQKTTYLSQTLNDVINITSASFSDNKVNIHIKTISPIKTIHHEKKDVKKVDRNNERNSINNIKIKVNKIKLEQTPEENNNNLNQKNFQGNSIHSIRRRFMNSKKRFNINHTPDFPNKKLTISEKDLEDININKKENQKLQNVDITEKPKAYKLNKIFQKEAEEINEISRIDDGKTKNNEEKSLIDESLKKEETELIPEIKFQSESEKENNLKKRKKFQIKKEKEIKTVSNIKKEERNNQPLKKIKKYNSFSFATLFSVKDKLKQKENNSISNNSNLKKEEKKCKGEEETNNLNCIFKRNLNNINSEIKLDEKSKTDDTNNNTNIDVNKKTKKKVTLSQEIKIEEINTSKPVVRYKISKLLYYNKIKENQLNNNYHYNKYNDLFIFGLDKSNLIKFNMGKRRFSKIKISDVEDTSDLFHNNYIYENTLIYNTFTGCFILTGENTSILFYYDKKYEFIIKLCEFSSSHNSGCLLLDKNKIFIFSGKNNNKCEYFNFITEKIEPIPELKYDRANSSFCFNKNCVYAFLGYSFIKKEYLFNIEYIDRNKLDEWKQINLDIKENILSDRDLINFSLFNYDKEQNTIFIYGGKHGLNDTLIEEYYYAYDVEKNSFEKIDNIFYNIKKEYKRFSVKKYQEEIKKGFIFDKQKQIIELDEEYEFEKNKENIGIIIDSDNNIHFLTKNRNYVNICQFLK